ncbi:hypothetical protein ABT262_07820, partial [Amycolatopsis mediterranei]
RGARASTPPAPSGTPIRSSVAARQPDLGPGRLAEPALLADDLGHRAAGPPSTCSPSCSAPAAGPSLPPAGGPVPVIAGGNARAALRRVPRDRRAPAGPAATVG